MIFTYKKIDLSTPVCPGAFCIEREDQNGNKCSIPNDPANSDYQQYLRWLEDPNAPEFTAPIEG
jgi:hypothetical protein